MTAQTYNTMASNLKECLSNRRDYNANMVNDMAKRFYNEAEQAPTDKILGLVAKLNRPNIVSTMGDYVRLIVCYEVLATR